jgi:hypothetical protein
MTKTGFDGVSDATHGSRFDVGAISRAGLLKRAALLGGGAVAAGGVATALARDARSADSAPRDARILNYVLRLEELKAAFYREAAERGALTGELQQLARVLARHERVHVSFLRRRLGRRAESRRTYDFGDATSDADTFASTAWTLEETAVAAYVGQGANLTRRLMTEFAQLCSVEGRHAAWIADVLDRSPAPRAADEAKAPRDVVAVIEGTGFETTT